jgi:hypothetical protein
MEQLALFAAVAQPTAPVQPTRTEPALWIARLLLLRELRIAEDTVIQDIRLRRGLNILWAPPSPAAPQTDGAPPPEPSRLTGHSAGKTTFCRLIRYLLGESRFGTQRTQDRIRDKLESGWVVGEVIVEGERWIVGRPFARGIHPFAARGDSAEAVVAAPHGSYQDLLAALAAAVTAKLPVKTLPHARSPLTWDLVLAWLSRDQEARFADLLDWRATASESESPNPVAADRGAVVRALLDLMSDEESELSQKAEALSQKKEQLRAGAPLLQARATEDRRRLAKLLGTTEENAGAGPLFTERWLHERRVALDTTAQELDRRAAEVEEARAAEVQAIEDVGARAERLRRAEERLSPPPVQTRRAAPLRVMPAAPDGLCGVPLTVAQERGCPLASAPAELAAPPEPIEPTDPEALSSALDAARAELDQARAIRDERHATHARLRSALDEERARLHKARAALDEIERFQQYTGETEAELEDIQRRAQRINEESGKLVERRALRRREHTEARERVERRFDEVVRALLGPPFAGQVNLVRGQIELSVTDRGERNGAALETIKLLAFDLAALALGVDGHGHFPGFLIHDGPREADMAEGIYGELFRYAAALEKRVPSAALPAFQYIVTTTGAPPEELQREPWLLAPRLDASTPEGRLLKVDL